MGRIELSEGAWRCPSVTFRSHRARQAAWDGFTPISLPPTFFFLALQAETPLAHGHALPACASCGIREPQRDPQTSYVQRAVADLPDVFKLTPAQCRRRDGLRAVELAFEEEGTTEFRKVDISAVVSCYKTRDGELYHLHPELVDVVEDEPRVHFCHSCDAAAEKGKAPELSLAAEVDYGLLSRIWLNDKPLEPLSDVELMLLSEVSAPECTTPLHTHCSLPLTISALLSC